MSNCTFVKKRSLLGSLLLKEVETQRLFFMNSFTEGCKKLVKTLIKYIIKQKIVLYVEK